MVVQLCPAISPSITRSGEAVDGRVGGAGACREQGGRMAGVPATFPSTDPVTRRCPVFGLAAPLKLELTQGPPPPYVYVLVTIC